MRKAIKVVVSIFVAAALIFGLYLYKLHALAVEGNRIFEYRCVNVNPNLIAYKKIFLMLADQMNNPDWASQDQVNTLLGAYVSHMRSYISTEDVWLAMDKKFTERWDFQLIEPWYIKQAGVYQWKMYEAYRDDAKGIVDIWDHPEKASADVLRPDYVSEARQRRNFYTDKYFEYFQYASSIPDWRKYFGSVPIPKGCTKENTTFPDTGGSLHWGPDNIESTPSSVPIDPYITT